jgi:hypothetical protein
MSDSPAVILFDVNGNPVTTIADGDGFRLKVDARKTISLVATRTSVNAAESDTLLLASNPNRISAIMYNDSDSSLYVGFGSAPVTLENYTITISAQSDRELPVFAGEIRGIWQSVSGAVRITEMT